MSKQTDAGTIREMMENWNAIKANVRKAMPGATTEQQYQATAAAFEKSLKM